MFDKKVNMAAKLKAWLVGLFWIASKLPSAQTWSIMDRPWHKIFLLSWNTTNKQISQSLRKLYLFHKLARHSQSDIILVQDHMQWKSRKESLQPSQKLEMSAMPGFSRFYPLFSLFVILSFISLKQYSANGTSFFLGTILPSDAGHEPRHFVMLPCFKSQSSNEIGLFRRAFNVKRLSLSSFVYLLWSIYSLLNFIFNRFFFTCFHF